MSNNHFFPCVKCMQSIDRDEKIVYCPDCKQIYHLNCWNKIGKKCIIKGCKGNTKFKPIPIDKLFLNPQKTKHNLNTKCSHCNQRVSIFNRFCFACGNEVNTKKEMKSLLFFPLLKFIYTFNETIFLSAILIIFILFRGFGAFLPGNQTIQSISHQSPTTRIYQLTKTPTKSIISSTPTIPLITTLPKTKTPTKTSTIAIPTKIQLQSIPNNYSCQDKGLVKLQIGANGKIGKIELNLRKQPVVPQVWNSNIIRTLYPDENFIVIGGPECSHDGTWWKIQFDNGDIGWSREYLNSNGYLLVRTSN